MTHKYLSLAFTESVRAAQERYGAKMPVPNEELPNDSLSDFEREFIAERDGFYMATVGEDGWPYVQFRGGPKGFLRALDDQTLAYADFRGNRQYISTGNLTADGRTSLFFMDYANRRRLKLMARAEILDAKENTELLERVMPDGYRAIPERVVLLHVVAFDWNCPQHITPRFTMDEIQELARIDSET